MTLYTDIKHLEALQVQLEEVGAIIDLLTEKTGDFDTDLSSEYARHQLVNTLFAVSTLIDQASQEATEAISTAYLSPANFDGPSFEL